MQQNQATITFRYDIHSSVDSRSGHIPYRQQLLQSAVVAGDAAVVIGAPYLFDGDGPEIAPVFEGLSGSVRVTRGADYTSPAGDELLDSPHWFAHLAALDRAGQLDAVLREVAKGKSVAAAFALAAPQAIQIRTKDSRGYECWIFAPVPSPAIERETVLVSRLQDGATAAMPCQGEGYSLEVRRYESGECMQVAELRDYVWYDDDPDHRDDLANFARDVFFAGRSLEDGLAALKEIQQGYLMTPSP